MKEAEFVEKYKNILKRNRIPIVDIDASHGQVFVPREYIDENGNIQLSLGPRAIRDLRIINDVIYCRASFNRQVFSLSFPLANINGIFEEDE